MICDFCGNEAEWVENKEVYGRNYGKSVMIWLCKPCDAYVGCHNNTMKSLGTIANKETREWRQRAHKIYDTFWDRGFKDKYWELNGKDRRAMKYMRKKRRETYEKISKDFG